MRTLFLFVLLQCLLTSSGVYAGPGYDGCYQLYLPATMYPAFCLRGTAEEGVHGAGVRFVLFHTNTDEVEQCFKSSASTGSATSFGFFLNGKREMALEGVSTNTSGRKMGTATFGNLTLNFMELETGTTQRLITKAGSDQLCKNIGW